MGVEMTDPRFEVGALVRIKGQTETWPIKEKNHSWWLNTWTYAGNPELSWWFYPEKELEPAPLNNALIQEGTYVYMTDDERWNLTEVAMLDSDEPYVMYCVSKRLGKQGNDTITWFYPTPIDRTKALAIGQRAINGLQEESHE